MAGCWQHTSSRPAGQPVPPPGPGVADCSEAPTQAAWVADPAAVSGKELIAAAPTLPGARAGRVGLYGISRGGHAALWAASTGADVQAVVVDAPAHRPVITPAPPSTLDVVAGLRAPLLIMHGTADPTVPVEQSREYERAARALGRPIEAVYFEGVGHVTSFVQAPAPEPAPLAQRRRTVYPEARQRAIAFLRANLLGATAPAQLPRTGDSPMWSIGLGVALVLVGAALGRPRRAVLHPERN